MGQSSGLPLPVSSRCSFAWEKKDGIMGCCKEMPSPPTFSPGEERRVDPHMHAPEEQKVSACWKPFS